MPQEARRKQGEQQGFAMALVLLFVSVCFLGAAVLVPRAVAWYRAALVQHETDCLVSDLRLLQQMSRTASVHPVEDPAEHAWNDRVPEFVSWNDQHAYLIWRRTTSEAGVPQSSILLRHRYPARLQILPNIKTPIVYGKNGGTVTPATIYVYYDGAFGAGKKVVLDSVGRIRVEAIDEKDRKTDG